MTSQTEAPYELREVTVELPPDIQVVTIAGIRYSADLFREFGGPVELNRWIRITARMADGMLIIESPDREIAHSDIRKTARDRDACVKFIADLFDELRHEHHPVHGYRGTPAMRADLQSRIAELLEVVAPELAPQPLRQDPPKPLGPDAPQTPQAEPAQPLRRDMPAAAEPGGGNEP